MAPTKNNLFDFDGLDEQETSPGSGPDERSRAEAEALQQLRADCERSGLSAGWSREASVLEALQARSDEWGRYGVCALVDECWKLGVRKPDVNPQRDEVLWRLRCALVWSALSLQQLEEECGRRGVPFYPARWWLTLRLGPLGFDYEDWERAEGEVRADLARRLMQDSWPEERGPLPPEGLRGLWRPRFRSGAAGLPAWTGDSLDVAARSPIPRRATEARLRKAPQPPPKWRQGPPRDDFKDAGPRVRWFYSHFPWFRGEALGHEAEFVWTDDELEAYFVSDGKVRPKHSKPEARKEHESSYADEPQEGARQTGPQSRPGHHKDQQQREQQQREQQQREQQQREQQQREQQQREQQQQQQQPQGQTHHSHKEGAAGQEEPKRQGERIERPVDRYFITLGLQPGAAPEEVKRTYRRLALRYHPDKAPGQEDATMFRRIQEAYEILSSHKD